MTTLWVPLAPTKATRRSRSVIGLIARWGTMVVITTGRTQDEAEEIALVLFREAGIELQGVQMTMIIFDPSQPGGLLIDPTDPVEPEGYFDADGWQPSSPG